MTKLRRWRPSAGTVLGTIAIIIAVIGTANASPSKVIVKKGDIAPGAVTARTLATGAVTAKKIRKGSVTAPKLEKGAVGSEALGSGAVTASKLAKAAVTGEALAPDSVGSPAIAPGSVYGGALGAETVVTKPIADLDAGAENHEWTASDSVPVLCGPGERVLGGGFAFPSPGDREVAWLEAMPAIAGDVDGVIGRITSNSGGTASGEVAAICLK
jgi:hypothetical protein